MHTLPDDPYLILSTDTVILPNDGVTTANVTITHSDGAIGNGSEVSISFHGLLPVNASNMTLDVNGEATFTFGPFPSGQISCGPLKLCFYINGTDMIRSELLELEVVSA